MVMHFSPRIYVKWEIKDGPSASKVPCCNKDYTDYQEKCLFSIGLSLEFYNMQNHVYLAHICAFIEIIML